MIIKIGRDLLVEPLKNIVGVSEKKQTMPILGNILMRNCGGKLLLVSSDLDVEISTIIDYECDGKLNTTLTDKKLPDILKSLPWDRDKNT